MSTAEVDIARGRDFTHISCFEMDDGYTLIVGPKLWEHDRVVHCEVTFRVAYRMNRAWNGPIRSDGGDTVRVTIQRSRADVDKSWARVDMWKERDREWVPFASLPSELMRSKWSGPGDEVRFSQFRADVLALLDEVRAVRGRAHSAGNWDSFRGARPEFEPVL